VFFEEAFTVRERNARTDTEEIDLVLEVSPDKTNLVFQKSPYLLVECKNWQASKVNQTAVTKLAGLLGLRHLSQGFLLTTGEFTADARHQAANAAQASQVEVVLIDGAAIEAFLADVKPLGDFLVELHRHQMLRMR
jgi:restriction endonuclease Mrr